MMRMLRKRTVWPALAASLPMLCTWSAMKPFGVRSSTTLATATPLTHDRIDVPIASTRNLFHSPILNALRAASGS